MQEPLWFKPSQLRPDTDVIARCLRCLSSRHLDASALPDVPMIEIERRLRCTDRGRDGRGPVCGSRAEIQIIAPTERRPDGIVEHLSPLR